MRRIREKKHRLPEAACYGRRAVHFTACAESRQPGFADPELVAAFIPMLGKAAEAFRCIVPIYCFMPDHLHVLIFGTEDASRPKRAMEQFKWDSGLWLSGERPHLEWQKDFHDSIVRRSEGFASAIRYVACNPVRRGLTPDFDSWPHTGAIGCDLNEVIQDAFWN